VFPDGTPFAMPENEPLPSPLEIGTQLRDQVIYLAVPLRKSGALQSTRAGNGAELTRYRSKDLDARDITTESATSTELEVAALNTRLMSQNEPADDFARIPVAHVVECRADRQVVLDDRFIPTVLKSGTAGRLATFLMELQGLLHQRAEALAARAVASGRGGASEIADFLMLQIINRYEPVVAHLAASPALHPEDLYRLALEITGELSTLTAASRRPPQFSTYRHDALRASFDPVINALRGCLSVVMEQNAIPIPLAHKKFGISVASVADQTLFDSAAFVLAARADVPSEDLRRRFPAQVKIGSVEKIRDLVNLQLPGITLQPMAVAPRQIPYHAGFAYFELDRSNELWRTLKGSGGIAIHQSGDFPNLVMELWAIRG
jgi:type VI secretion system protein ImpJ